MTFLCFSNTQPVTTTVVNDSANCNGFIAEHSSAFQSAPTLYDLFNIPLVPDLQTMFMTGFTIPIVAYLTAYAYGVIINWFSEPEDYP
jgi:hypothetical protein